MRNITRWLLNRYGKQKDYLLYLPNEHYTQWVKWPKHIVSPTKMDTRYIDSIEHPIGKAVSPGGDIRMVFHKSFVWYFSGQHSLTFSKILFPDGTEWSPFG